MLEFKTDIRSSMQALLGYYWRVQEAGAVKGAGKEAGAGGLGRGQWQEQG